jgi:predicted  nucleic acid-binding Zn-ribbon protein|tara:strand:+ start:1217 stop:1624 length:408 start_codon:yes stop_codon:yes gene_type:complete
MELIYFISGILTVGVVYGVNLLRHVKSSHTDLLDKYQSQSNISSLRYSEMGEMVDEMKLYVNDIQTKLEKDSYKEMVTLKKKLDNNSKEVKDLKDKLNININTADRSFSQVFNEIQTVKSQVKKLGEDPNFISRY